MSSLTLSITAHIWGWIRKKEDFMKMIIPSQRDCLVCALMHLVYRTVCLMLQICSRLDSFRSIYTLCLSLPIMKVKILNDDKL